jgi:hypothetical protein
MVAGGNGLERPAVRLAIGVDKVTETDHQMRIPVTGDHQIARRRTVGCLSRHLLWPRYRLNCPSVDNRNGSLGTFGLQTVPPSKTDPREQQKK